jgi:nicotinate-nucleotide pyrophosphorylase (carboxylating)
MRLSPTTWNLIDLALEEDLGRGDVTAQSIFGADLPGDASARAVLVAKQSLVVYGHDVARAVFQRVDPSIRYDIRVADGAHVEPAGGKHITVAELTGPAAALLAGERTALNFLQRLSGVATQSRRYAEAVRGSRTRIVDTRKTTPGWRALEKAAVVAGGCHNHRFDLGSGVLIKDNHIAACGGVAKAVTRARSRAPHPLRIEVEVTTLAQLDEALSASAEVVLLDNMDVATMKDAITRAHARGVLVEVSGGITLDTLPAIAALGPDLVSVGALTHSARAVDLSLDFVA